MIERVKRDIIDELSSDSFKDQYGLNSKQWLENLTSEFNPNLKQPKNDDRRRNNE